MVFLQDNFDLKKNRLEVEFKYVARMFFWQLPLLDMPVSGMFCLDLAEYGQRIIVEFFLFKMYNLIFTTFWIEAAVFDSVSHYICFFAD